MKPISDKLYYELCFAGLTPIENKQTMIQLTEKVFAIELPKNATTFELYGSGFVVDEVRWNIIRQVGKGLKIKTQKMSIPPGNWRFLCTSKECSEEQAAGIVDKKPFGSAYYKNYFPYAQDVTGGFHYKKAKDSLLSLLRSKSLALVNNNYALLIKED